MQLTWESSVAILALVSAICGVFLYITTLIIKREISEYHDRLMAKFDTLTAKIDDEFMKREIADIQFKHYGQLYDAVSQRVSMLNDILKQSSVKRGHTTR